MAALQGTAAMPAPMSGRKRRVSSGVPAASQIELGDAAASAAAAAAAIQDAAVRTSAEYIVQLKLL